MPTMSVSRSVACTKLERGKVLPSPSFQYMEKSMKIIIIRAVGVTLDTATSTRYKVMDPFRNHIMLHWFIS